MRTLTFVAVVGGLVVACSSSSRDTGACAERNGTYLASFAERSGSCGKIPEQIYNLGIDAGTGETCVDRGDKSRTACHITLDTTCTPGADQPDKLETIVKGSADWSTDATTAHGIVQFTLKKKDGAEECSSTYDVTFRKQ